MTEAPCFLVCGGRDYWHPAHVALVLDTLLSEHPAMRVISGGASGADSIAAGWAKMRGVPVQVFKADWQTLGRAAGPLRNQRMIDEGKPDVVVAFPGGRGTEDMLRRAQAAGIPVREQAPMSREVFGGHA